MSHDRLSGPNSAVRFARSANVIKRPLIWRVRWRLFFGMYQITGGGFQYNL